MVHIGNSWDTILQDEFKKDYYLELREFLKYEYSHLNMYIQTCTIFLTLLNTQITMMSGWILGQDPYHDPDRHTAYAWQKGSCSSSVPEEHFHGII